jgi:hypothetical protein
VADRKVIGSKRAGGIAIPPGEEKAILQSLAHAEGLIRHHKDTETLVVFDQNGKGIFVKRSEGLSVDVRQNILDRPEMFYGAVLTHNHPLSSSFSGADVATACLANAAEIRVASTLYTYSIRPKTGVFNEKMWDETLEPLYVKHYRALQLEMAPAYGQMDRWNFERLFTHELWRHVSAEENAAIVYNREERMEKGEIRLS